MTAVESQTLALAPESPVTWTKDFSLCLSFLTCKMEIMLAQGAQQSRDKVVQPCSQSLSVGPTQVTLAEPTGSFTPSHTDPQRVKLSLPPSSIPILILADSAPRPTAAILGQWRQQMARVLFPPPDPQNLGATCKSAAASKSSPASSLPRTGWRGQRQYSTLSHPHWAVGPGAAPLGSHPTNPALGQPRKKGSPAPNTHRAASLWVRLLLGKEGAKAPVLSGSISPDRVAAGTRSFEGWRTCSKGAPSPSCLGQSPFVLPPSSPQP